MKPCILYFILVFVSFPCFAQNNSPLQIALINDSNVGFSVEFENTIKSEISDLLSSRTDLTFESYYLRTNAEQSFEMIEQIYEAGETDIVIGIGLVSSVFLSRRDSYPIPTISNVVIDRELLGLPITEDAASGIHNYTYIQSPFDVKKDLEIFYELTPYKKLGLLLDANVGQLSGFLRDYFEERVPDDVAFEIVNFEETPSETAQSIGDHYDALYILSFGRYTESETRDFFHELNHLGIPTFSLTGRDQVRLGAMAGMAPPNYILSMIRRLAVDVMKIAEGINASELPVTLETSGEDFVINMQTLKHLKLNPDFDLLNQAILLDLEVTEGEQTWSLESLIYESLKTNLGLIASRQEVALAEQDVKIASSNLLPDLSVSSSATLIDQNRVDNSNGQAATLSWLANATLTQAIYNEPALANVAIQKILKESQDEFLQQAELDVILETAAAFLSYLQAKSIVRIQNENVDVTHQNLNISESKAALGYSAMSEVYRWRTQLAQNIIDLNIAISNLNQARININRIINRDQREEFNVVDIDLVNSLLLGAHPELENRIRNQRDLDRLTDFFVIRCFEYLPELKQLGYSLEAQERSLLSSQRSLYVPKLNLQASADQPVEYFGASTPLSGFPGLTKDLQWAVTAQVTLPIFQGGFRKANIQRDKISIDRVRAQQKDLTNSLEAQLRSNMQILSASYQQVELSNQAADYSNKNFEIIQDLYRQGQTNIITLVDAQNASLTSELNANNAVYQLLIDYLTVERSIGTFYFLMTEEEKSEFIRALMDAVLTERN